MVSTGPFGRKNPSSSRSIASAESCRAGGTILGTTNRGNPFSCKTKENGQEVMRDISDEIMANSKKLGIDAIITIGGDGSQKIGYELFQKGMKITGVPKAIDNDLSATDFTF